MRPTLGLLGLTMVAAMTPGPSPARVVDRPRRTEPREFDSHLISFRSGGAVSAGAADRSPSLRRSPTDDHFVAYRR